MAEIRSEYINQELTKDGITMVTVSIEYPVISGMPKTAARRINALYRHGAAALLRRIRRRFLSAAVREYAAALERSVPFKAFEAVLTYTVTYNGPDMLSLYREFRTQAGGERTAVRYGDTWSVLTGWLISLDALFPPNVSFKKALIKNAAETAVENSGTHRYLPKCEKLLRRHFSPDNFYVTSDGIAIFYGEDTIAPKSEGIRVFVMETPAAEKAL